MEEKKVTEEVAEKLNETDFGGDKLDDLVTDIMSGSDLSEDWSPEEREKVEALFATLDPPKAPEPPKFDLREHFKKGDIIKDPNGLRIVVRSIGDECMTIGMVGGGKKRKFVDGYQLTISGLAFVTKMSRGKETVFQFLGMTRPPAPPQPPLKAKPTTAPEANAPDEPSTMLEF